MYKERVRVINDYTSSKTRHLVLELPKLEHGKSIRLVDKLGYKCAKLVHYYAFHFADVLLVAKVGSQLKPK